MRPVWSARVQADAAAGFAAFSESTRDDAPFFQHDIAGSIAHVHGLARAGILSADETAQLVAGLRKLAQAWQAGTFRLDPALEDVHMNIEAALTAELGDVGRKLHTGRSRNDQVATCITLYSRAALARLASQAHALSQALGAAAASQQQTPWTARTHGQAAQPATLGFLLAAHAFRFQDLAEQALWAFDAVGESPLGSGAVAGSTLPLDPAHTAELLGLRPPRNALLATGSRDTALMAVQTAAQAGVAAASLAQDLLDLHREGQFHVPDGYATGSSLMPHKRNPDALELVRGTGRTLPGDAASLAAVLAGVGLGYQRDFQVTKPILTRAMGGASDCLETLQGVLAGGRFQAAAFPDDAGIVATDVAESLVAAGVPFRRAYEQVAAAYADAAAGHDLEEALASHIIGVDDHVWRPCLVPDPARRATRGGPAPAQVQAALLHLEDAARGVQADVEAAEAAVQEAARLVAAPMEMAS